MEGFVDYKEYRRILSEEFALRADNKFHYSFLSSAYSTAPTDIRSVVDHIRAVALNSTVLRSYVESYGMSHESRPKITTDYNGTLYERPLAYESDGAHANLMCEILDHALIACYGPDFGRPDGNHPFTIDGYSYQDIMRAARTHDLTENITGDRPDNSSIDEKAKLALEDRYFSEYTGNTPSYDTGEGARVYKLLREMSDKSTPTGRLLYISDKFAATFITLTYDSLGYSPALAPNSDHASPRDFDEMMLCGYVAPDGRRRASEMWTVDMLRIRKLIDYDDTGFVTACLVMYTLMVHGQWYKWRKIDYDRRHNVPLDSEKH